MEILIRLAGVQLGPYSEEQVRQHLTDGLLSLTDAAKLVGGPEEWVTLAEALAKASQAIPNPQREPEPGPETAPGDQPELNLDEPAEPVRRAPDAPPGVRHLPSRAPQELSREAVNAAVARKSTLLGPTPPGSSPGAGPGSSSATTSPLPPPPHNPKKTTGSSLVKALAAQQTAPLPTKLVHPPAKPPTAPIGKPPAAPESDPRMEASTALIRSLTAKTVPMRSGQTPQGTPLAPMTTPMPTKQIPTKPIPKATPAPPSVVDDLTKKLGQMVMPDPTHTLPPGPGAEAGKRKFGSLKKKEVEPEVAPPPPADEPDEEDYPVKSGPKRILPALIAACGVLALVVALYIWSPYHAAASLRTALNSGDPARLASVIDFPSVRKSLKDQIQSQIDREGIPGANAKASVIAEIDDSIDAYVTPAGLSQLITNVGQVPQTDHDPLIAPDVAAKALLSLNSRPTKARGLASLTDFVIDRDVALLHLGFQGLGWKLNRIDLRPDWLASSSPGSTAPLLAPVVDTYFERGDAKARKSDWAGAIAAYTQVLDVDPHSSIAYNARGNCRIVKGDLDGAIQDYSQAIAIDPQMAMAYFDRGNAKAIKEDQDGAIADYTQAIRIDPTMAQAYDNRGNAKTAKGDDMSGAIADFTQAISLDPARASAYSDRGFARQANGNLDGAITDYTQALALAPKTAIVYYNRGLARQSQGNLDAAIVDFDRALALNPKIADAYYYRGNAKSATHDLDGAIADYTQAITLSPKLAMAYSNRGQALQAKGDLDHALDDYTKALSLDPRMAAAYYNRANIRARKNDLDGAIADTSQALDLDPKNAPALYTRGFAKLTKGNLDGAATDLKQFCDLVPRDHNADHARLYRWLIAKAQNAGTDPDQELSDALENNWNSSPDDLITKTATFLLGRTPEADYLAAAASPDAKTDQSQHCLAWYFVGMKRLLTGDKAGAIEAFHQCVATAQKEASEYLLALAELQGLQPPPAAAAPPTVTVPAQPGPSPVSAQVVPTR